MTNTQSVVAAQVLADYEARRHIAYVRRMRIYRQTLIRKGILKEVVKC